MRRYYLKDCTESPESRRKINGPDNSPGIAKTWISKRKGNGMKSGHIETEFQLPVMRAEDRHRLVVRARVQGIRIAAIWQVLLPFARNVEHVGIKTFPERGFEEVEIALVQTGRDLLDSIVSRFNGMSWVTSTTYC
jgi:hypothetical protein